MKLASEAEKHVRITNCGGADLIIDRIKVTVGVGGGEFDLDFSIAQAKAPALGITGPTPASPLRLKTNAFTHVAVRYRPQSPAALDPATKLPMADTAQLSVIGHDPGVVGTLPLSGFGMMQCCPKAKIVCKEGTEAIPQTMLHLSAEQSLPGCNAPIVKYQWTAKQPAGSSQVFEPGATSVETTFTANAAGAYTICLEVWDANGVKSCNPACLEILILPEEAIHVELLWDTPNDPNQSDTGPGAGADLDLHFAHPEASGPDIDCDGKDDPWFSNPYDTFWFNPNPNWGSASPAVNDDPSMDLDDTDGAGPENLNLDVPEGSPSNPVAYSVGVHYWNDNGFGTSFATVNIYIMGVLMAQFDKVELKPLDMWNVGRINWPNTASGGSLAAVEACYQTPGAAPCGGFGKAWQPTGAPCVTPCYVNPSFGVAQGIGASTICEL